MLVSHFIYIDYLYIFPEIIHFLIIADSLERLISVSHKQKLSVIIYNVNMRKPRIERTFVLNEVYLKKGNVLLLNSKIIIQLIALLKKFF